jgi:putative hemolysin
MSQLVLAFGIVLVAWLTAGAMAVRSASRIWLRHWAERRLHGAAAVTMYLERPQQLLTAANAGVAVTLALAGVVIGWRSLADAHVAVLGLVLYAGVIVVAGQLVPRALARRWPSLVIPLTMPVLRATQVLTAPLLAFGRPPGRTSRGDRTAAETADADMQALLREGELEGVGQRDEIAIINGVMHFGRRTVRDAMTARADVFAVSDAHDAEQTATLIAESKFSRVPVYRGSLDTIVGMYHAFDVIRGGAGTLPPLRPVARAPAETRCNDLLFRMLRQRLHLAVVHDAAGQTLGIATLENLLEELVGDIRDEHDEPASRPAASP